MPLALILFIGMPILEIALLLRVGSAIGWIATLLVVIFTAVLGSAMLRQQGLATLNRARTRMDSGEMPAQQLLEGVMIMIGGVLLLTPGFVTDAFGFACLVPFTRQWLAARIASRALVGFSGAAHPDAAGSARGGPTAGARAHSDRANSGSAGPGFTRVYPTDRSAAADSRGDIIDGEYRRLDDD
jgi:UPF0716 protein FxsA